MPTVRLDEEDEVEREKPLEPLAPGLELDLYVGAEVIRDPDSEVLAVGVIPNPVTTLRPPIRELLADVERSRIQENRALLHQSRIFGNPLLCRLSSLGMQSSCLAAAKLRDLLRIEPNVLEHRVHCAYGRSTGIPAQILKEAR